jgi:hypothetical protein
MAQFPIEIDDSQAINEAINYLLSGPAGLGQNFQGFSAYLPAYIRPSGKQPWSLDILSTLNPSFYLNIPINDVQPVGGATSQFVKFVFTSAQPTAPFQYGDSLETDNIVAGGVDPNFYNDSWTVYSSTTTDVTVVTSIAYTWPAYVSGGDVGRNFMNYGQDTDCNARVTVAGPTDQVFVSAQLDLSWEYDCTTGNDYNVVVSITRLRGFPDPTPGNNDYLFADTVVVSEKTFYKTVTPGTGTQDLEAIFTTVLDGPNLDFGYYWYILTVKFVMPQTVAPFDITIGKATTRLRSLTAQSIKQ